MMIENLLPIVKDIGLSAAVDRICLIILGLLLIAFGFFHVYIRYLYEKEIEGLNARLVECQEELLSLKQQYGLSQEGDDDTC